MIERFHGIDRHKRQWTICVLDTSGAEVRSGVRYLDPQRYIGELGPQDAVVMESATGAFYWADQVERRGARCFIIDPHKFRIIKDSWKKTDKNDSRNMAKALWVHLISREFGLPTVYKPSVAIREPRKYFAQLQIFNRQATMVKNSVQSVLEDNGVVLPRAEKETLLKPKHGLNVLDGLAVSPASRLIIEVALELLWKTTEQKERIHNEILLAGEPLKDQVEILMSIRGVSALIALAFLADVGDIRRFPTVRRLSAYLGLAPRSHQSADKYRTGHINRASRPLTRTLLTQALPHIAEASDHFGRYYRDVRERRGAGRGRIALMRKVCATMRRMLLDGVTFRTKESVLYEKKKAQYRRRLRSPQNLQQIA